MIRVGLIIFVLIVASEAQRKQISFFRSFVECFLRVIIPIIIFSAVIYLILRP